MTRQETAALFDLRRDAIERKDLDVLSALYSEDCVLDSPTAGHVIGRNAIEEVNRSWFRAFPDLQLHVETVLIDGLHTAELVELTGSDGGGFMGLAPTGRPFRAMMAVFCTVHDQHIVHERRVYDFTGVLVQIGVLKTRSG